MSRPPRIDRRKKRPYPVSKITDFLGWPMTICIAAACDCLGEEKNPRIVLVSDAMFSMTATSTEVGLKLRPLRNGWIAMFAGDDVSQVDKILLPIGTKMGDSSSFSEQDVMEVIRESYEAVRNKLIENTYLSSFSWSMADFLAKGRNSFPESHYLNLLYEIERLDIGCQLLVAGFQMTMPSIFEVRNPGVVIPTERFIGYSAIGSGAINAVSFLTRRNQGINRSLADTLYNSVAAKHLAEKALGVGTRTVALIAKPGDENPQILDDNQIAAISKIWEEEDDFRPENLTERASTIIS